MTRERGCLMLKSEDTSGQRIDQGLKEVEEIFKKYDLAGSVQVTLPKKEFDRGYKAFFSPSWSCIKVERDSKKSTSTYYVDEKTLNADNLKLSIIMILEIMHLNLNIAHSCHQLLKNLVGEDEAKSYIELFKKARSESEKNETL